MLVSSASALEELVWGLGLSAAPLAQVPVLDELALEVAAEPPFGGAESMGGLGGGGWDAFLEAPDGLPNMPPGPLLGQKS